jgi:hypothetical protein
MPKFIIDLLVKLAVAVGLPWLMKKFPGLPAEIWAIVEELLKYVQNAENKPEAVRQVGEKVRECTGSSCPADTKGLD